MLLKKSRIIDALSYVKILYREGHHVGKNKIGPDEISSKFNIESKNIEIHQQVELATETPVKIFE